MFILIFGNGLSNTLIAQGATAAAISGNIVRLIRLRRGGMLVGCIAAPACRARRAHPRLRGIRGDRDRDVARCIRCSSISRLGVRSAHATGFCFAGLYAAIESWMHDKAENVVRGRVLALYQIIHYCSAGDRPANIDLSISASVVRAVLDRRLRAFAVGVAAHLYAHRATP